MRLIFIPGYGEEEFIFEKIHPQLEGEKVFVDTWALIGDYPRPTLTALVYARQLVDYFNITGEDVVIGHSMGGWIALHIKHLVGCPIVQIASWTDQRKIYRPVKNRALIYWLVKRGLYHNEVVRRILVWKKYRNKPSAAVFSRVFNRLKRGDSNKVVNQLRVIFNPVQEQLTVSPELRIHAQADSLVRFPDAPTHEVPGDHFTLYTQPEEVYQPIRDFLQQQLNEVSPEEVSRR